jgi:ABC-type uncharacterized transport system YnjBCD ATPase subunit
MLPRPALKAALQAALARAPVVALLGPRQCGKTTLARQLVPVSSANYFGLAVKLISVAAQLVPARISG